MTGIFKKYHPLTITPSRPATTPPCPSPSFPSKACPAPRCGSNPRLPGLRSKACPGLRSGGPESLGKNLSKEGPTHVTLWHLASYAQCHKCHRSVTSRHPQIRKTCHTVTLSGQLAQCHRCHTFQLQKRVFSYNPCDIVTSPPTFLTTHPSRSSFPLTLGVLCPLYGAR